MAETALEREPVMDLQSMMNRSGKAQFVMVDDLHVDRRYQPEHRQRVSRVKPMAEAWDQRLACALMVSCRRDGTLWIIDGATRHAAAKLRRETIRDDVPGFWCILHFDLTLGDEARLFRLLNGNRLQVHVVDRYRAAVLEEDPVALAVYRTLNAYQLRIGYTPTPTDISAVQAVEHLHLWDVLSGTLEAVEGAWRGQPTAHSRPVLLGLGAFLYAYRERGVAPAEVVEAMPGQPEDLLEDADYVPEDPDVKSGWARVAVAARDRYTRCHRGRRLPRFSQPNLPRAASSISGRRG